MRRLGLATAVALRLAITLAVAMGAYALLERYRNPGASWHSLWGTHLVHVMLLTPLLYAVLLSGFERLVGRPLRRIRTHLYKVATGRLELLEVETSVREIAEVEASVNLMVRRMRLGAGDADPHRTALALRDVAATLHDVAPDVAEAMMNAAAALEQLASPTCSGQAPGGAVWTWPRRGAGEGGRSARAAASRRAGDALSQPAEAASASHD